MKIRLSCKWKFRKAILKGLTMFLTQFTPANFRGGNSRLGPEKSIVMINIYSDTGKFKCL